MKNSNTALDKMLGRNIDNHFVAQHSRLRSGNSRKKSPYSVRQSDLIPSREVDQKKIKTVMQYQMAIEDKKKTEKRKPKSITGSKKLVGRPSTTMFSGAS
jgi:hypothetical protein